MNQEIFHFFQHYGGASQLDKEIVSGGIQFPPRKSSDANEGNQGQRSRKRARYSHNESRTAGRRKMGLGEPSGSRIVRVTMSSSEKANEAVRLLDGKLIGVNNNRKGSIPREVAVSNWVTYPVLKVSDVELTVTKQDVKSAFGQFGPVKNVYASTASNCFEHNGEHDGTLYVEYERKRIVSQVVTVCDRNLFMLKSVKPVRVTLAQYEFDRRAALFKRSKLIPCRALRVPAHIAQPKTVEWNMGIRWRALQKRHEEERYELQKRQDEQRRKLWEQIVVENYSEELKRKVLDDLQKTM
jgi:hypothetical protein